MGSTGGSIRDGKHPSRTPPTLFDRASGLVVACVFFVFPFWGRCLHSSLSSHLVVFPLLPRLSNPVIFGSLSRFVSPVFFFSICCVKSVHRIGFRFRMSGAVSRRSLMGEIPCLSWVSYTSSLLRCSLIFSVSPLLSFPTYIRRFPPFLPFSPSVLHSPPKSISMCRRSVLLRLPMPLHVITPIRLVCAPKCRAPPENSRCIAYAAVFRPSMTFQVAFGRFDFAAFAAGDDVAVTAVAPVESGRERGGGVSIVNGGKFPVGCGWVGGRAYLKSL